MTYCMNAKLLLSRQNFLPTVQLAVLSPEHTSLWPFVLTPDGHHTRQTPAAVSSHSGHPNFSHIHTHTAHGLLLHGDCDTIAILIFECLHDCTASCLRSFIYSGNNVHIHTKRHTTYSRVQVQKHPSYSPFLLTHRRNRTFAQSNQTDIRVMDHTVV